MKSKIALTLLLFKFIPDGNAQTWTGTAYTGRMFTGMFTGLEFSKKVKKHEWYFGIGLHSNTYLDDEDGKLYTFMNRGETTTFLSSFGPKWGWRRIISIKSSKEQIWIYPYVENHWLHAGLRYYKDARLGTPTLIDIQEERLLTGSINFGLGSRIFLNKNFSFSFSGGMSIAAIFPISYNTQYYNNKWQPRLTTSGIGLYNWQLGLNYTLK